MVPLLSAFYFGSVEHYRILAQYPKVIIDTGEHYERQSYRTRTSIVGPNSVQDLVVPIVRRSGEKMAMHSVAPSYSETWAQQHLHAIRSAYGNTPWFIHYIDEMEHVLLKKYERLVDLDLATLHMCMKWLGLKTAIEVSASYVENTHDMLDLRTSLQPKKAVPSELGSAVYYTQVFEHRHGYVPRMSLIDLVCNCGPSSKAILSAH